MKWYLRNKKALIKIYPIDQHPGDSTRLYKLDYNRLEKYLHYFQHSRYVSVAYLIKLRQHFVEIQAHLNKYPQWDGPIVSYESYDPFEVAELAVYKIDQFQFKLNRQDVAYNKATVYYTVSGLKFTSHLTNINGQWLIDDLK